MIEAISQTSSEVSVSSVDFWTIGTTIIALLSAFFAFRSNNIAKKALKLAQRSYEDKQSNFSLYLIDSYRWTGSNSINRKCLLFHITINNLSDSKSSYKAELEIEYLRKDRTVSRVIIPHDKSLIKLISHQQLTVFDNDIRIEERGIESKWLVFEQPNNVFSEFRIEKYTIKLTDTRGEVATAYSIILKELNEKREENNG